MFILSNLLFDETYLDLERPVSLNKSNLFKAPQPSAPSAQQPSARMPPPVPPRPFASSWSQRDAQLVDISIPEEDEYTNLFDQYDHYDQGVVELIPEDDMFYQQGIRIVSCQ